MESSASPEGADAALGSRAERTALRSGAAGATGIATAGILNRHRKIGVHTRRMQIAAIVTVFLATQKLRNFEPPHFTVNVAHDTR